MTKSRKAAQVTEDERQKLIETHKYMVELNRAFFEVPIGSPQDERPLIEDIRTMRNDYKRRKWAGRMLVWVIPTGAGLVLGLEDIVRWVRGFLG